MKHFKYLFIFLVLVGCKDSASNEAGADKAELDSKTNEGIGTLEVTGAIALATTASGSLVKVTANGTEALSFSSEGLSLAGCTASESTSESSESTESTSNESGGESTSNNSGDESGGESTSTSTSLRLTGDDDCLTVLHTFSLNNGYVLMTLKNETVLLVRKDDGLVFDVTEAGWPNFDGTGFFKNSPKVQTDSAGVIYYPTDGGIVSIDMAGEQPKYSLVSEKGDETNDNFIVTSDGKVVYTIDEVGGYSTGIKMAVGGTVSEINFDIGKKSHLGFLWQMDGTFHYVFSERNEDNETVWKRNTLQTDGLGLTSGTEQTIEIEGLNEGGNGWACQMGNRIVIVGAGSKLIEATSSKFDYLNDINYEVYSVKSVDSNGDTCYVGVGKTIIEIGTTVTTIELDTAVGKLSASKDGVIVNGANNSLVEVQGGIATELEGSVEAKQLEAMDK